MRLNPNEGLAQGHENRHMQDPRRSEMMQLHAIGPQQGMEKSMRWHTESLLVECCNAMMYPPAGAGNAGSTGTSYVVSSATII
jgi:hypothetical protein